MQCNVISEFFKVVGAIADAEKNPIEISKDYRLYHAEFTFLEAVHRNSDVNAKTLAKILCITRGAVTQLSNKLEEKGLVEKYHKPENKKEKFFRLTTEGEKVKNAHEIYHKDANEKMCNYLSSLDDQERNTILKFLDTMMDNIPVSIFDCKKNCMNINEKERGETC